MQFKKGQTVVNGGDWFGVVTEGTRGKNPTIIQCVEVFGFEHESGSAYVTEYRKISVREFNNLKLESRWAKEPLFFKGELIDDSVPDVTFEIRKGIQEENKAFASSLKRWGDEK